tara:strand:- start:273 stop:479 length:207 start_codon:yes stop_codon:yes gene_type:complete
MSKTTQYIIKKLNDTPKKYNIVLIVEEDDSMTLPQEVRQRVLADGFDTEEDAVEEMNYIIDDYVDAHG